MIYEDGFHFHSLKSLSGETKSLIVVLHGAGNHPDNYIAHALETQKENPDADILILKAPVAIQASKERKAEYGIPDDDDLYTWYDLEKHPVQQIEMLFNHVFNRMTIIGRLNLFIDRQLEKRGLKDKDLALIGYSMGGIVAVQAAVRRKEECAAVVCHSGAVLPLTFIMQKPDTLMIMGDQDNFFYLPEDLVSQRTSEILKAFNKLGLKVDLKHDRSVKRLRRVGISVDEKIFPGQNHCVTKESWKEASDFVAKKFKIKK